MKQIYIFIILTVAFGNARGQQQISFSLDGWLQDSSINKIEILFIKKDPNFYVEKKIIQPVKGKFKFIGKLPYTYAAYLRFNDSIRSDLFFLDGGIQKVLIKSIDSPLVITGSKSTLEYNNKYLPKFAYAEERYRLLLDEFDEANLQTVPNLLKDSIRQEINKVKDEEKYILYEYAKRHPNSYVAFWDLFFKQMVYGYHQIYENTYKLFPKKYKANPIGLQIHSNLKVARDLDSGNAFPKLKITEYISDKEVFFNVSSRYTLVDFWFSSCAPCIAQFPELKRIYQKYKNKGFEIVNISIDSDSDLWKNTIKELELPWLQFLDIGGRNAYNLAIYAFPATFLLDNSGKIIKKKITLSDLEKFLKEKMVTQ